MLPKWGGSYGKNNTIYSFTNTCALDTWFSIIRFLECEELKASSQDKNLLLLINLIFSNDYIGARMLAATCNKIISKRNILDFYGSEMNLFIMPFLSEFFSYTIESGCSFPKCPGGKQVIHLKNCLEILPSDDFSANVSSWFTEEKTTRCSYKCLPDPQNAEFFQNVFEDVKQSGYVLLILNGQFLMKCFRRCR